MTVSVKYIIHKTGNRGLKDPFAFVSRTYFVPGFPSENYLSKDTQIL